MTNEPAEPAEPPPVAHAIEREERREAVTIDGNAVPEDARAADAAPGAVPARKGRKGLIAIVAAAALGGGGWFAAQSGLVPPEWLGGQAAPQSTSPQSTAPQAAPAQAAPAPGPSTSDLAAIEQKFSARLAQVEGALQHQPAPGVSPADLAALDQKLAQRLAGFEDALKRQPAPPPASSAPAPDLQPLETRLAETAARLALLEEKFRDGKTEVRATEAAELAPAPAPAAPSVDLSPIEARLTALDQRMQALDEKLAAADNERRAAETAAAAASQAAIAAASSKPNPAALAVVAQSIARAVDTGAPFAPALSAARALGAPGDLLAPLQPLADKGAPSGQSLARGFADVEKALLAAAEPPAAGDASIMDRMSSAAAKLVRVRPASDNGAADAPALAARIEAALARGAVGEALAAWNLLPDPSKLASKGFGEAARARAGAENAAAALSAKALENIVNSGAGAMQKPGDAR